ncbi:hypothetical protein ABZ608_30955 [Streptomyces sp. NPDC013172]|uniref:hypothetical protein n=1 Tax=Streptomyces sp. NPDC013172 TaxID=3155009 RepID=UPI00340113DC
MGTSLTPEFWERFAVLLVLALGVTCVLAAFFDDLVVRLQSRRAHRRPPAHQPVRHRAVREDRRTAVHS